MQVFRLGLESFCFRFRVLGGQFQTKACSSLDLGVSPASSACLYALLAVAL